MERFRGERRIELYILVVAISMLALIALRGSRSAAPSASSVEQRLAAILSQIDGAGRVSVMLREESGEDPGGVVIVADGLVDVKTYLNLQRAARAATGFDADRIAIIGNDGMFGGG